MQSFNRRQVKFKGVYQVMKKTQEIISLPIISISDGMEIGKVKSIIINADKGAIDYIDVDGGIQSLSTRVIPTENILGIGEYALTIEDETAIIDINKIPAAIDLIQKNVQVKGTKVLTKKGNLIGEIGDIYIDENDVCRISGLEFIADATQKRIRIIPRESVITFGKNLIVVKEDVESSLLDRPTQLGSGGGFSDNEKKNLTTFDNINQPYEYMPVQNEAAYVTEKQTSEGENVLNASIPQENITVSDNAESSITGQEAPAFGGGFPENEVYTEANTEELDDPSEQSNAASLFEQRQRQYLNGRRATKTITDNQGNILVTEGVLIDDQIIDAAKASGKLIELVMNNKA